MVELRISCTTWATAMWLVGGNSAVASSEVSREDQPGLAVVTQRQELLDALDLDASGAGTVGIEIEQRLEVRVFGPDAAEVVPRPHHDGADVGVVLLGVGGADVRECDAVLRQERPSGAGEGGSDVARPVGSEGAGGGEDAAQKPDHPGLG